MRRLQRFTNSRDTAGLDGFKPASPIFRSCLSSESEKVRFRLVNVVISLRVGLPQFDHCVRNNGSTSIEYAEREPHSLSLHAFTGHPGNCASVCQPKVQIWASGLRRSWGPVHRYSSNGVDSHPRSTMSKR